MNNLTNMGMNHSKNYLELMNQLLNNQSSEIQIFDNQ
jgi:hypothetical protein